jgi:hypothetical protein
MIVERVLIRRTEAFHISLIVPHSARHDTWSIDINQRHIVDHIGTHLLQVGHTGCSAIVIGKLVS